MKRKEEIPWFERVQNAALTRTVYTHASQVIEDLRAAFIQEFADGDPAVFRALMENLSKWEKLIP